MQAITCVLPTEANGVISLNEEEMKLVAKSYDYQVLQKRVKEEISSEFNLVETDFDSQGVTRLYSIVDEIIADYRKSIGFGCADRYAMETAFDSHREQIEELLEAV